MSWYDSLKENPHGIMLSDQVETARSWQLVQNPGGRIYLWHDKIGEEITRLLSSPTDAPDTLRLFGMRNLKSMNSWLHNSERLVRAQRTGLLMNPDDAAMRGISDGEEVEISTPTASLNVSVEVSEEVVAGSVCYPHGWGHRGGWRHANATKAVNINLLASDDDIEQISGASHLDGIRVRVRALKAVLHA